jgi:lipopolysaccharide/colanic/teichoic acid biosynthesis glycosyltransferase
MFADAALPLIAPANATAAEVLVPTAPAPQVLIPAAKPAYYEFSKRLLDILISLVALVAAAPIFLVIAIVIKITSPGPVLFKHRRLGRDGCHFWCYKFRTMVADAEEQLRRDPELRARFQENYKLQHDPRITRIGALLRRTSMDELPQFFNVLRGEMTLIGPRPIVAPELSKYGVHQERLLTVKPGLSGFWQVQGRSETSYEERIEMDMFYVSNRSLSLDLKLLCLTVIAVFRKTGAY